MLRRLPILVYVPFSLVLIVGQLSLGCRGDSSVNTEEESAYMADYEAPETQWGFMNSDGNLAIRAAFDDAGPFSEGLAAVNIKGKWGYIDREGKTVIPPVFKSAWAFHEGFARVEPFDQPDQFINQQGIPIPSDNWSAADDFSNGRARVKVGNSFGYIDSTGNMVIQPIYTRGWNFQNGISIIEYQEKLGVIDLTGHDVIKPEFDKIKKIEEGNFLICKKEDNAIVCNNKGEVIWEMPAAEVIDGTDKIISVRQEKNMFLIDLGDPSKRSKQYSNIIYLEEDLWAGKSDSGYLLLDHQGTPLSTVIYNQINKFSEGFAVYSKGQYWGYLDTSGLEVTDEVFGLAWDYREGFARAAFKDGIAFIDRNQKLAFYPPPGTLDMRDFSEGLAAVQID